MQRPLLCISCLLPVFSALPPAPAARRCFQQAVEPRREGSEASYYQALAHRKLNVNHLWAKVTPENLAGKR